MKQQYLVATILAALPFGSGLSAQPAPPGPFHIFDTGGSLNPFDRRAVHKGAVYELKLRIPSSKVETYLETYARWYLPVDQADGSGRKLIDVLQREHGDHYNLVFLYWYQSAYKENYYCDYARAFFTQHQKDEEFKVLYEDTRKRVAPLAVMATTMSALAEGSCKENRLPLEAAEVIRQIDSRLRDMVELNEASWNFGVNPCLVWALGGRDVGKAKPPNVAACAQLSLEKFIPH